MTGEGRSKAHTLLDHFVEGRGRATDVARMKLLK
jgi:hypothetical protein